MRTRLSLVALLWVSLATAVHADDWQPDPGFKRLFNGKDLTGWCFRTGWTETPPGSATSPRSSTARPSPAMRGDTRPAMASSPSTSPRARSGSSPRSTPWRSFPKSSPSSSNSCASVNADSGIFLRKPQLQCRDYLVAGPYKDLKKYRPQDWNQIEVVVKGGVARCTCNDEVLEAELKVPETGPIGLEGDRGQMEYRRIQIK